MADEYANIEDLTAGIPDGDTTLLEATKLVDGSYEPISVTPKKIVKAGVVELTGTLEAGETTITFQDSSIKADSTLDFYTDVDGVVPKRRQSVAGVVSVTFDPMNFNLGVKVEVR